MTVQVCLQGLNKDPRYDHVMTYENIRALSVGTGGPTGEKGELVLLQFNMAEDPIHIKQPWNRALVLYE